MLRLCDDRFHRAVRRDPVGGTDGTVVVERRVVLLSRDAGLASTVGRLLSNGDHVAHCNSAAELADWSTPEVAAVVLDSQPNTRRLSYKQVRERYDGPLVMLLDKGERPPDLPPDGARRFLHRPFKVAELSGLLATPTPELGSLEAAIIAAWSRHATAEPPPPPPRDPSYRVGTRNPSYRVGTRNPSYRVGTRNPSLRRRARAWAAMVVALMGLLLAFSLGDHGGSCASGCTTFGGAIAGAAENGTPLAPTPAAGSAGGGSGGGRPPGSSAAASQPPTPTGGASFPVVTGIGGLIQSINPITSGDTTPPAGPKAVPGVPAPPGVPQPNPPPGTSPPPTTGPPTTAPPTTAPPTTAPPTTAPPTTAPPTTAPPTTAPPTTAPPTTEPPTTAPPTTAPPTTAPPTTEPPTTAPPTTAAETTAAPTTT
jgi:hypothetical protein